jgi:hypothetical protein
LQDLEESDEYETPEEPRSTLQELEKNLMGKVVQTLRLLIGAGERNLRDLTLLLPRGKQGRYVSYEYENDIYFLRDLLDTDDEDLRAVIRAIGLVKKLSLGRTELRDVAERIAREMKVEELTLTWKRTSRDTAEEDPQWVRSGWMLNRTLHNAYKDLRAI